MGVFDNGIVVRIQRLVTKEEAWHISVLAFLVWQDVCSLAPFVPRVTEKFFVSASPRPSHAEGNREYESRPRMNHFVNSAS